MSVRESISRPVDILLAEDNPADILLTRDALEETTFNVRLHVAEDGDDAVNFLYRNCSSPDTDHPCPDLILLDINLPRKNGKEILAEIKRHPDTLHVPVVMLTAFG